MQLVYENRPRDSTRRSPSPPRRPNSALQQMRRLDSGACELLYTLEPSAERRKIPSLTMPSLLIGLMKKCTPLE